MTKFITQRQKIQFFGHLDEKTKGVIINELDRLEAIIRSLESRAKLIVDLLEKDSEPNFS